MHNILYCFFSVVSYKAYIIHRLVTFCSHFLGAKCDFFLFAIKSRAPPFISLKKFKLIGGNNIVILPKRNRSKDNPYVLDFDENKETYVVKFKDNKQILHIIEITEEIYRAFDKFELEDISQIHKFRRHIEHNVIFEDKLIERMFEKPITIEDEVEDKILMEELKQAIDQLSEIQKRRVKLYYFEGLSVEQIAKIEGASHQAVSKSIFRAVEKIKQIIKM